MVSFGIMYGEFLKSINAETSAVAVVIGSSFGAMSCAALFANILFHTISMRSVGLFGATIFFVGSLLCAFATSIGTLIFAFSILQGNCSTYNCNVLKEMSKYLNIVGLFQDLALD